MLSIRPYCRRLLFVMVLCLAVAAPGVTAGQELSKDQIKEFLLKAKVIRSRQTSKGVTLPFRLTLTDGTTTHDAVFQSIDERRTTMQLANGATEINFVDSYKYNLAAYELSVLLGIDDLLPIHVERRWNGKIGSLSWFLPVKMDDLERRQRNLRAPDADAWNRQMHKIRVFDELVYDNDANLTNVLIGENWQLWRVDFSRAFRLHKDVKDYRNLEKCDRQLLQMLKELDEKEFRQRTKNYLNSAEAQAVMARRDKIVAYFQKLIAEKGESEILY